MCLYLDAFARFPPGTIIIEDTCYCDDTIYLDPDTLKCLVRPNHAFDMLIIFLYMIAYKNLILLILLNHIL